MRRGILFRSNYDVGGLPPPFLSLATRCCVAMAVALSGVTSLAATTLPLENHHKHGRRDRGAPHAQSGNSRFAGRLPVRILGLEKGLLLFMSCWEGRAFPSMSLVSASSHPDSPRRVLHVLSSSRAQRLSGQNRLCYIYRKHAPPKPTTAGKPPGSPSRDSQDTATSPASPRTPAQQPPPGHKAQPPIPAPGSSPATHSSQQRQ